MALQTGTPSGSRLRSAHDPPAVLAHDSDGLARLQGGNTRSLVFALLGTFVLRCASYSAGSIIPIFLGLKSRTDADITANLAALIAVTFYGAELLTAPLFGALSDRFGRKPFMLLGPILGGVAIQMLGFSAVIPVLVVVRVLEGLSTASSSPATLGYISARTAHSDRLRGRVMGFYEAATVVGLATGAAIAGQLYERLGVPLAFTVVALVYGAAFLLFLGTRDHRERSVRAVHGLSLRRMFNRRIMRFAPAWVAANAAIGAWLNVGPFVAAQAPDPTQFLMGGYKPTQIGVTFLVFGLIFTAGAIVWGYVMPTIGRQATLLSGVAGLGFTSFMLYLINDRDPGSAEPLVLGLAALVGLGVFVEAGFTPAALAYLAEIAEEQPEDRGSVMGVYSVLLSVGQLLGSGLAGPFAARWGMNGLIVLTGLLTLMAGFTVVSLGASERRRHRQSTAGPAHPG